MNNRRTILVIGSGAREHALCWALRKSPDAGRIYMAPGHGGLEDLAEPIGLRTEAEIVAFAEQRQALVVVGPEQPLADGLADKLRARGVAVVGPSAAAARVESSKAEAKALMARLGIPTAAFVTAERPDQALDALGRFPGGVVVKADGLAQGKGVVVAETRREAAQAVLDLMTGRRFGPAGDRVVLEERLAGTEMSFMVLTDGVRHLALPASRDYKRLGDNDEGPNTGGMGAIAPHPALTPALEDAILERIVAPLLDALAREGRPFSGVLYAGLMLTDRGPYVLEWNARLGDPETGVVLPLLHDDLLPYFEGVAAGRLPDRPLRWSGAAVGVVMAAPGYPEQAESGIPIALPLEPRALVFQAGTERVDGTLLNRGGRTLLVVGRDETLPAARSAAYREVGRIGFPNAQYRRDIGG